MDTHLWGFPLASHIACLTGLWVGVYLLAVHYYRNGDLALDPLPHHHKAAGCYTDWDPLTTHLTHYNNCWHGSLQRLSQMYTPSPRCRPPQQFPCMLTPVCSWQDLSATCIIKKNLFTPLQVVITDQIFAYYITPLPILLTPIEALGKEFLLEVLLLWVLVNLWQTLQWSCPSSPQSLPPRGHKELAENRIPALLSPGWAVPSCAVLPSGLVINRGMTTFLKIPSRNRQNQPNSKQKQNRNRFLKMKVWLESRLSGFWWIQYPVIVHEIILSALLLTLYILAFFLPIPFSSGS